MRMPGRVFLVGAGPGDPDLLTVKALRLIGEAEVVVFDRLVSDEILSLVPHHARRIFVGKSTRHHPVPQHEINAILVREARSGRRVVRLKGGDPFIFGRGSEEALAVREAGIPCEVVPGITAAQGCAASAGVPLTHRGLATGVRLVTGHCQEDRPLALDWSGLADPETTLVVYMGAASIARIATDLIAAGLSPGTPVLAINNGTTPRERRLVCDLRGIGSALDHAGFDGPVLFIIGRVVSLFSDGHAVPSGHVCPLLRDMLTSPPSRWEAVAHG